LAIFGSGRISSPETQSSQSKEKLFSFEASNQSTDTEAPVQADKLAEHAIVTTMSKNPTAIDAKFRKDHDKQRLPKNKNKSSRLPDKSGLETDRITRGQSGGKKSVIQQLTCKSNTEIGMSTREDKMAELTEEESQDGSRDLFDSQTSQGSLIDEQIDITLQVL
jgi:hypothetical protein